MRLLGFIRDGSPVAVITRLEHALKATDDDTAGKRALVEELTALDRDVHDAACRTVGVQRLGSGVRPLVTTALERAARLGLMASGAAADLEGLSALAEPLAEARVAENECRRSGARFYLLLVPADGGFKVVSARRQPFGLDPPSGAVPPPALAPPEDVVTPYIPVAEEAL